jgi:hypothetical protein
LVSRGSRRIIFFVMWMCSLSVVNMSVILWNQPKYGVHETNLSMEVSKPERKKVNQIYIWNKLVINRICNNVPPNKLIMWKIKISEFIQESPLWKGKFLGVQLILLCIGTLNTNLFFKKILTNKFKFISLFKYKIYKLIWKYDITLNFVHRYQNFQLKNKREYKKITIFILFEKWSDNHDQKHILTTVKF